MNAYKLSDTKYRVPVADYSNGVMADGYVDIGPDHPDFDRWTPFVVPLPKEDKAPTKRFTEPEVIDLPPTYAATVERDAQREIARKWRDRRLQRERDADKT